MAAKETKDTIQVTVRLPRQEYEALRTYTFLTNASQQDVLARALREFLTAHGSRGEEFDALFDRAREQYAVALDKLADL